MHKTIFRSRIATFENLVILGFLVFGFLGISYHEMWRDEMQAWLLARDHSSLAALFQTMRFEGHPALWHLCLYAISQVTHNVFFVQVFHLFISLGIVYLIVKRSPFSPLHKFLLSFSYFIFFEYTFISRNYNLGILFLLLFCVVYRQAKTRYWLLAIFLALAANTNIYAFILSVTLAIFWGLDTLWKDKTWNFATPAAKLKQLVISGLIIALGWSLSVLQFIRIMRTQNSPQIATDSSTTSSTIAHLGSVITDIWESYFPIPIFYDFHFWNKNILTRSEVLPDIAGIYLGDLIAMAAAIILFGLALYFLRRNPPILWAYVIGNLLLMSFRFFIHDMPGVRHQGHFFILLILSFWLLGTTSPSTKRLSRSTSELSSQAFQARFLTLILSIQFLAGIYAAGMDYLYPFSTGKAAAAFLQSDKTGQELADTDIIGSRYRQAAVLSGYLDRPIYYPERREFGSFWTNHPPEIQTETQLLQIIDAQASADAGPLPLVALNRPLESSRSSDFVFTELKRFEQSIVSNETFYLYKIEPIE